MKRLIEKIVFCGLVTCCRFAGAPTSRWPSFVKPTTDGVVRPPSAFGITVGSPPSRVAMHELVVPRSMPIVFATETLLGLVPFRKSKWVYSRYSILLDDPDQDAAGHDEAGAGQHAGADVLRLRDQERGQRHAPERLGGDERRDDRHTAVEVGGEQ